MMLGGGSWGGGSAKEADRWIGYLVSNGMFVM